MGRFFWLKLQAGFFEQADVKVVMSQKNGPEHVVFWLKLLLLALKQEEPGELRFKDEIPFSPDLLSTVLDTNIDFVRAALELFQKLGMIQIDQEGTIFLDSVNEMIGSECSSTERVRRFRERQKATKKLENDEALHETLHSNVEKSREEKSREDLSSTQPPDAVGAAPAEMTKEQREVSDIMAGRV